MKKRTDTASSGSDWERATRATNIFGLVDESARGALLFAVERELRDVRAETIEVCAVVASIPVLRDEPHRIARNIRQLANMSTETIAKLEAEADQIVTCDQCDEEIDGTTTAFDAHGLRFCNFYCLEAYDVDHSDDDECEAVPSGSVDR